MRMKNQLITIILILNIFILKAQDSYEKINKDVCVNLESMNIKSLTKSELIGIRTNLLNKAILKDINNIREIKTQIKKDYPKYGTEKINFKVQADLMFYLLESCPKYLNLTKIITKTRNYPNKKCLEIISKDFNEFLQKNSTKPYKELNKMIDKKIIFFLKKHQEIVYQEYNEGVTSREFRDDLISYLMMNSDIYFKATLHDQYEN
jgi:hypothetical protein